MQIIAERAHQPDEISDRLAEIAGQGTAVMDKKLFSDLVTSLKQAGRISRGERKPSRAFRFSESRVRAIRERTGVSQADFARLLRVSVKTLQNWEQSRRHPTGPAAALLRIVELSPKTAIRALNTP